jgi:hypothetical protein
MPAPGRVAETPSGVLKGQLTLQLRAADPTLPVIVMWGGWPRYRTPHSLPQKGIRAHLPRGFEGRFARALVARRPTNSASHQGLAGACHSHAACSPRQLLESVICDGWESRVRLPSGTPAVAVVQQLHEDPERRRARGDGDQPLTASSGPLSPERRLAPLRDIRDGRYALQAAPSPEAQAVLAAKLAEWRKLQDMRLRTVHETTAAGVELRVAVATVTLSGLRFLEEHDRESGEPTEEG